MYNLISLLLILSSFFVPSCFGSNILFFIGGASSYSHRAGLEPLAQALASKGHNVTFFSPIPPKNPHPLIHEVSPKGLVEANTRFLQQFGVYGLHTRLAKKNALDISTGTSAYDLGLDMCRDLLDNNEFQNFSNYSQFHLLIIDKSSFSDCAYGLAWKWNAKVISYVAVAFILELDFFIHGIPMESSWIPAFDINYSTDQMSFYDRVFNEISHLLWYYKATLYYIPRLDSMMRHAYGNQNMPSFIDLVQRESIIFANQHYSDTYPKSLPPFVIPVGGMAVQPSNKSLPEDLEAFLSDASDGFIYISFGSIIKISSIPPPLLNEFLEAFGVLNLKFLWKWEGPIPDNAPSNILFRSWLPQTDVLAHPRIKGFITQGGQISVQEAVHNGVPLILLPVFGDQAFNAKRARQIGNGIELEIHGLKSHHLVQAINRLITDPSYKTNSAMLSRASKSRPLTPLQGALWWTEFVLQENNLSYLKPMIRGQSWPVVRSLDVFAFLLTAFFLLVSSISSVVYIVVRLIQKLINSYRKTHRHSSTRKIKSS